MTSIAARSGHCSRQPEVNDLHPDRTIVTSPSRKDSTRMGHLRVTPIPSPVRSVQIHGPKAKEYMRVSSRYEIRVKGILDGRWTAWFENLEVTSDGAETVISGLVADQAALHGLLAKVRDLGLFLIPVRHLDPD
jgi:hypothetical protein